MENYTFSIRTTNHQEFIEITEDVQNFVKKSKVRKGFCIIMTPHTTAGITINQNADINVQIDMLSIFDKLVPRKDFLNVEGNSDSHFKQSMFGNSKMILIDENKLILGEWQAIFLCEFDGPRARKVFLQINGE
jgi:secondary thiamine-phosphate synthase enzyme